jgi:ATP-dependent phosphofructokinase / diphosphate-dependent phosphofructokinase
MRFLPPHLFIPSNAPTRQRTVAIPTPGGDAPGLMSFIHHIVHAAHKRGWRVLGIRDGYLGLTRKNKDGALDPDVVELTPADFPLSVTRRASTSLCSVREEPVSDPTPDIIEAARLLGIDAFITPVGDGSLKISHHLEQSGIGRVNTGVSTIDNDAGGSQTAMGFYSAVRRVAREIMDVRATSMAYGRYIFVESMGRHTGNLALAAGLKAKADVILIPEIKVHYPSLLHFVTSLYAERAERYERERRTNPMAKKPHVTIVVAEGVNAPEGGIVLNGGNGHKRVSYGGIAQAYADRIKQDTGTDVTCQNRTYGARGTRPSKVDIRRAKEFAESLVAITLDEGKSGQLLIVENGQKKFTPMAQAINEPSHVPQRAIAAARRKGVYFGEAISTARGQVLDSLHA